MRTLTRAIDSILESATRWESRGVGLATGRCIVALAILLEVVYSSNQALFGESTDLIATPQCQGVASLSVWCLSAGLTHGLLTARIVTVIALSLVLSGWRPRWTCVPHWYLTFSLGSTMSLPSGGDAAAEAATLLLIPICLADNRLFQWSPPVRPVAAGWRGAACAAHLVLRLQVVVIYTTAAVSKVTDPAWSRGVAMYFVFNDPLYGLPAPVRSAAAPLIDSYWPMALLAWSVIVVEFAIAIGMLGGRRMRLVAAVLAICLHLAIGILMALPSFALVMIGLITIGYAGQVGVVEPRSGRQPQQEVAPS